MGHKTPTQSKRKKDRKEKVKGYRPEHVYNTLGYTLVVCICLHPDALSSVVLISVLIYQSAACFLDGSRVSEGLVRVMVIWPSICLSLAQLFLLRPLMTVVVHSFVADSSLLDCCDLVVFFVVVFVFFHLMLAGRQPFGFLKWFQLFYFFHLVSAVCLLD